MAHTGAQLATSSFGGEMFCWTFMPGVLDWCTHPELPTSAMVDLKGARPEQWVIQSHEKQPFRDGSPGLTEAFCSCILAAHLLSTEGALMCHRMWYENRKLFSAKSGYSSLCSPKGGESFLQPSNMCKHACICNVCTKMHLLVKRTIKLYYIRGNGLQKYKCLTELHPKMCILGEGNTGMQTDMQMWRTKAKAGKIGNWNWQICQSSHSQVRVLQIAALW